METLNTGFVVRSFESFGVGLSLDHHNWGRNLTETSGVGLVIDTFRDEIFSDPQRYDLATGLGFLEIGGSCSRPFYASASQLDTSDGQIQVKNLSLTKVR